MIFVLMCKDVDPSGLKWQEVRNGYLGLLRSDTLGDIISKAHNPPEDAGLDYLDVD